ncbi:DUF4760 domain-containing protein [Caldisericum sp.]|uniref:DUF4760 domain-containing protein n=1 Tax=Caldisericum sp. TaxID=2499687 RepID=UPI003CB3F8C0
MDYNMIIAYAAIATSLVAVITILSERQISRFTLSVELLLILEDRFNNEKMIRHRQMAAKSLLKDKTDYNNSIMEILTFFEMIGLLIKRRALDEEMVWEMFCEEICYYYMASKKIIEDDQSKDPAFWRNLDELYKRISSIDKKKGGNDHNNSNKTEQVKSFLEGEAAP